jgi:hypothetical protein
MIAVTKQQWDEYFFEWTWPEESESAEDLARRVLGVGPSAGLKEIKRAYRRLAQHLHPDTDPSDKALADRFKVVAEAYEILTTDRNVRTRKLGTLHSHDTKQPQPKPYPEWWLQQFKDSF